MIEKLTTAQNIVRFVRPLTNGEAWLFIFSFLGSQAILIFQATTKTFLPTSIGFLLCFLGSGLLMVPLFFIARSWKRSFNQ
jgi:hypothetical protein